MIAVRLLALLVVLLAPTRLPAAPEVRPIPDADLAEISGLVADPAHPGVLWALADSGNAPALYALDEAGAVLGGWTLDGAENRDWEELVLLPGAPPTLLAADIGDNDREYDDVRFYSAALPDPWAAGGWTPLAGAWSATYPEGPRDAEAMLADPVTGETLLVTKRSWLPAEIYRLELRPDGATLDLAATVDVPGFGPLSQVTGGAVSPDGSRVALLSYSGIAEWDRAPGQTLLDALDASPRRIPLPDLAQAEAIAYSLDGSALYVASEGDPAMLATIPLDPDR